jgi:glutathione synthase/RimK-type ligase-like ATP-grasp enzyme
VIDLSPAQSTAVTVARQALAGSRPAVVAHDPWWALGLELLLPETVLFCVQRTGAVDILRNHGVDVFCLSEHVRGPRLAYMSAVDVFEHPAARQFAAGLGAFTVIAIRPNGRLSGAIEGAGGRALGSADSLDTGRRFENKLAFIDIARQAGVPTPRWEVVAADAPGAYGELSARLGSRLVVQAPRGNAGQRTWFVDDQAALDAVRTTEAGRALRVGEMIEGLPFTANGIAGADDRVVAAEASRQVTGVDWLTPMALGSSGNAYGEPLLAPHAGATAMAVRALGAALVEAGYRGMFGVDLVLGDRGPVVIETNPRLVASVPLASQLEVAAGRVPALLAHLLAGLGVPTSDASADSTPLADASQVMVRRLPGDGASRPDMKSGVYRLAAGREPELLRPAVYVHELEADDEALILVRDASEPVSPGKEFARIFVRGAAAENQPGVSEAVEAMRAR